MSIYDYDDDEAQEGIWTVTSMTDPRWNNSGNTNVYTNEKPEEIRTWIKNCKKNFGKLPADLDTGFWPNIC